ncbi:photosynthetic complex putative assembly protein PuhB [Bradyrhizobium amphicarpaeae]|uniref:PH domain-containing protein n=1 Tax=Bradyrhizobium amphicarpaeae TaxID=1404768 RepID=A0A2U8PYG9_9BRAD|nr:photosynthetic complex putative assembly protein PuhB [Bradyrhizobium amphicarpaeae]AWM02752.1 PH domain-containing protein [Bradyrhizobium amphicarpaeae]
MKQDHQQFKTSEFKELPTPLPVGERVIWQGKPSFKGLALRSFHIREVAIYFGLLLAWRLWSNWSHGMQPSDIVISALWLIAPAISAIAVLAGLAWLFRRAACYTLTSKRILFQFGVALPMTMNIPLSKITNAALKKHHDGSGDIPLGVSDSKRVSYLLLWPHIRPWRLREPEPMLCALPDAAIVAAKLSEALGGQPAPAAVALSATANRNLLSGATANSPSTAAA